MNVIPLEKVVKALEATRAIVDSDADQLAILMYTLAISCKACGIEKHVALQQFRKAWDAKVQMVNPPSPS